MFYPRLLTAVMGFVVASTYGIGAAVLRKDRSLVARDYARVLARLTLRPLGVRRMEVQGEENLHRERPCIFICNHQSYFDVPVLAPIYPERTVVVAKKEIRKIPLFGWLYRTTGNILIDRSNRKQAVGQLKQVSEEIRRRRAAVWIFPEGTRGTTPGELLPFKKGAFQMAIAAQCPIVPVVVSPLHTVIDAPARRARPGTIGIRVLDPIPTAGLTEQDVDTLLAESHRRMSTALRELVERHGLPPAASRRRLAARAVNS